MKNKMLIKRIKTILIAIIFIVTIISSMLWIVFQNSKVEGASDKITREFYQVYRCEYGHISTATGSKRSAADTDSTFTEIQTSITKCAYAYAGSTGEPFCNSTKITPIKDKLMINGGNTHFTEFENVYCVAKGQSLSTSGVARNWEATAVAHIRGNNITFVNYYEGDEFDVGRTPVRGNSGEWNNVIAALANGVSNGSMGYGDVDEDSNFAHIPSYAQIGIWYFWNTWVNQSGALNYGFETATGNGNFTTNGPDGTIKTGKDVYDEAVKAAKTKTYNADIYFLEYFAHNNPTASGEVVDLDGQQELIMVEIPEEPTTIDIPVQKVWNDNVANGNRPESITVKLYKTVNGVKSDTGKTLTLSSKKGWSDKFTELPKTDDSGNEITYTISEVSVTGYNSKISGNQSSGFTITNTERTVNKSATKTWDDDNNRDGLRPASITVTLYADGVETARATLEPNNDGKWPTYTFSNLPEYKNKKAVKYTVAETEVDGYKVTQETVGNVYKITNTHEPEKTNIKIVKKWNDANDLDEYRPDSITVKLSAKTISKDENGNDKTTKVDVKDVNGNDLSTVVLTAPKDNPNSNIWEYEIKDLFKKQAGNEIIYTIEEVKVDKYTVGDVKTSTSTDSTGKQVITLELTNTYEPDYEGYIEINGKVWLDRPDGKANNINGILDSDESGLAGITVILKDANGKQFDDTSVETTMYDNPETEINEEGTYTIKVNYDNNSNVYKLHDDIEKVQEKLKTAYVEFVYDGMVYTTVNPLNQEEINAYNEEHSDEQITTANVSTAIENEDQRNTFDGNHSEVTTTTTHPNDWTDKNITAKTENTIMSYYNDKTIEREEIIKYCNGDGTYIRTNRDAAWEDIEGPEKHTCTDANCKKPGHSMKTFNVKVSLIENVNLGLFKREQPDVAIGSDLNDVFVTMNAQEYTYYYNTIIDNPKKSDLKAQFQDDNGTHTYRAPVNPANIVDIPNKELLSVLITYQVRVLNNSTTLPITVDSIINVYDSEYELKGIRKGISQEDIEYMKDIKNIPDDKPYKINSKDLMYEKELQNRAQDISYISSTIYKDFAEKTGSTKSTEFNEITLNNLNITVQPQGQAKTEDIIWITYSVSIDSIKGLLAKDATLSNGVEIHTYSTSYGTNTLYAEQRTHLIDKENGKAGRSGTACAGYDYDSQPGNAGMYIEEVTYTYTHTDVNGEQKQVEYKNVEVLKATNNEDDDHIAPSLVLCKGEPKILSGNVWVDSSNGIPLDDGTSIRLGDGKNLDGREKGLANAKVELYKVNEDGSISENPATLYRRMEDENGNVVLDEKGKAKIEEKPAITYSDANGNYSFGSDRYSVETDRYVMKFTYGEGIQKDESTTISSTIENNNENTINARNYKSTIIAKDSALYEMFKGTNNDDEWHLKVKDGYSVAVDDINARLGIADLQYSNFEDEINMVAYSKPFKMQVEFDPSEDKSSKVNDYGTTQFGHNLSVFDFGIVERARENIVVNKTVDYMYFKNSLDQTVTQGNPADGGLNYVNAPGLNLENSKTAPDKFLRLEYDAELLHNSELDIRYKVTVENKSEVEYDYYLEDTREMKTEYYYFGTNTENAPRITTSVNYLVDYIDRDVSYTWEEDVWRKIDLKDLWTENGTENLISNESAKELDSNKYDIYITDIYSNLAPGQTSVPQYAKASKTLTNNGENVIEDHIEILQLDSKSARTIRETVDGTIISKEYRPGNYVPCLDSRLVYDNKGLVKKYEQKSINLAAKGVHEQDDDRIKITITPGTGVTNYITTYIIAGVIGLMVIVIGVIFIKKKVLIK